MFNSKYLKQNKKSNLGLIGVKISFGEVILAFTFDWKLNRVGEQWNQLFKIAVGEYLSTFSHKRRIEQVL